MRLFIKPLLYAQAYIISQNIPCYILISALETLLLGSNAKSIVGRLKKMFEEIAADAVKMLMFLFFVTLAFIIVSGALWLRASKNNA